MRCRRAGFKEQLGGPSSIAAYIGSKRAELKGSVISGERVTGWSKLVWHGIGLLLLLMQLVWAVLLQLLRLQNSLWKVRGTEHYSCIRQYQQIETLRY